MGFSGGSDSKVFTYNVGDWVYPWVGKIPWRRVRQPTPVFLPGESPWTQSNIDKETEQACKTTGRILIFSRAR